MSKTQQSQTLMPSLFKIHSKQIQEGNFLYSDDVKSVRDLFTYSEKHCEAKSFGKMEAWINEKSKKTSPVRRGFQQSTSFLGRLRAETSNDVTYKFVASPEFKPGSYFLLPENQPSFDYNASRIDRCVPSHSYIKPNNRLCKDNFMRKEFCEVVGKELCLNCNGGRLRERFNRKISSLYPCLEYDKDKRPYGYCPRAVRLTEPLPSRMEMLPKEGLSLTGRESVALEDARRIRSGRDNSLSNTTIQVFIKPRPYTS